MEHRTVRANGLDFAYFEEGKGPLVLMVHGFPDTAHTWDVVRPAVAAAGYRVVTPFQRGYFPTEIPKEEAFDADTLGRDVLALIEALGEKSAIVVGHDWGAGAAYSAAGLDPSRVELLITLAIPHPAAVVPTPALMWKVRHFVTLALPGAAKRIREGNLDHIDELVARWSGGWKVPPDETKHVRACFAHPGSLEAALGYYRALRPMIPPSQRKKVSVPAVAFAGESDILAPEVYERARRRFTNRYEVVRMPGGHFMHREHPEVFLRELLRVLAAERTREEPPSKAGSGEAP